MLLHAERPGLADVSLDVDPISAAMAAPAELVIRNIRSSIMTGIIGRRGGTKSGTAAYLAAEKLKHEMVKARREKRPLDYTIFHNGFLRFGRKITVDDIIEYEQRPWLRNGLLVIDEVQEWFDPLKQMTLVQYQLSHMIVQPRKLGLSIMWTTQKPRMISGRLQDQTDFLIISSAIQRPWRPKRAKKAAYFTERFAPRCTQPLHKTCTKYPKQHTVALRVIAEENSPLPPGTEEYYKIHCIQRFYPLWDSEYVVKSDEVLTRTADTMRQKKRFDNEVTAGLILLELIAEGHERIGGAQFAIELATRTGGEIKADNGQAGKMLSMWLGGGKRNGRERYHILQQTDQLARLAQQTEPDGE